MSIAAGQDPRHERSRGERWRLFVVLAGLYVAQGVPGYLFVAAIPPILREQGVSRSTIGLLALLMLPLVLKFLWAPMVDRVKLAAIGHRRSWILPTQAGIIAALALTGLFDPADVWPVFVFGTAVSLLASTQDIATDGYATRSLRPEDRGIGNAIQGGATALSVILGGTVTLILYEHLGWAAAVYCIVFVVSLPLLVLPWMREDEPAGGDTLAPVTSKPRPSLRTFLKRPETASVLAVAFVYRASEGLVKAMENPYLVDAGLPLDWIGYLSGLSAATAGLAGSAIAAYLVRARGVPFTLVLLGGLRTVCFALFTLHAVGVITGMWPVMGAAGFQTLIRYMEIVALYSLFMAAASPEQPGTDFTILACAQLIVYLTGSMLAGVLADLFGYGVLFGFATAISAVAVWGTVVLLRRRLDSVV